LFKREKSSVRTDQVWRKT